MIHSVLIVWSKRRCQLLVYKLSLWWKPEVHFFLQLFDQISQGVWSPCLCTRRHWCLDLSNTDAKTKEKKRQMTSWRKSIWISQVPKQKTMTLENNCLNLKMWHMSQFKKAGKEHAKTMPVCYISGWISFRKSHTEDCTKHILSNVLDLWLFLERSFAKQNLYVFCSLLA